ncbi:MAG TPA: YfhO family protein, partial [Verrucomicrobiae bacterium]|nr:YfhO family protein [Verrucomicrobiae bacterium]
ILAFLFAAYSLVEAFRKDSVLAANQRSFVKFWAGAAFLSLLFAFGRHAPFYKLIYSLPYFSTIRNPVKFMHPFSLSIVILFGYGLHSLLLRARNRPVKAHLPLMEGVKDWWTSAKSAERNWIWGCLALTGAGLLGLMLFSSASREITAFLGKSEIAPAKAAEILRFSYKEIGWFFLFWLLGLAVFVLFLSGRFNGNRFRVGAGLLAAVLIVDMIRANSPWISYYDYREKYASNAVLDLLKENPHEHRVTAKFNPFSSAYIVSGQDQMNQIYSALCNEWLQHQFQFYKIQALDITQMPRIPEMDKAFLQAFQPKDNNGLHLFGRLWQLTNTRYVMGEKGYLDFLNSSLDPGARRFTILTNFDVAPKNGSQAYRLEDFTVQVNPGGRYSVFDFKGALPRAALYSHWEVNADAQGTLTRLADTNFNPLLTAILESGSPPPSGASTNGSSAATITKYQPTSIDISAEVKTPSLLVLFDKYDPQWTVTVDGKPANLLRADFIFRGVMLEPGSHQVHLSFRTPLKGLYVSLASIAMGFLLCLYVGFRADRDSGLSEK